MDAQSLEQRVAAIESRFAIEELQYRYAECVDLARFEDLGELFRYGVMKADTGEGGLAGPEAVISLYRDTNRVHDDGTLRTRHQVTNPIVEVDLESGTARSRSYFVVLQATDALPLQPIVAGRYHDTFHRIDGTWWFDVRMIRVDQIGDMREHLTVDLTGDKLDLDSYTS